MINYDEDMTELYASFTFNVYCLENYPMSMTQEDAMTEAFENAEKAFKDSLAAYKETLRIEVEA